MGIKPAHHLASIEAKQALWAPTYAGIDGILGLANYTQLAFGDPKYEAANFTTFTTRGAEQHVYTWVPGARTAFDSQIVYVGPGQIPAQHLSGTEDADTPDIDYYSRDDASNEPLSVGMWFRTDAIGAFAALLTKGNTSGATGEWAFYASNSNATPKMAIHMRDASAGVQINRSTTTGILVDTIYFGVFTYDGAGGAAAADTLLTYLNGALDSGDKGNNASYVAMENLSSVTGLGENGGSGQRLTGVIYGGPCGPLYGTTEWTANQIRALMNLMAPQILYGWTAY